MHMKRGAYTAHNPSPAMPLVYAHPLSSSMAGSWRRSIACPCRACHVLSSVPRVHGSAALSCQYCSARPLGGRIQRAAPGFEHGLPPHALASPMLGMKYLKLKLSRYGTAALSRPGQPLPHKPSPCTRAASTSHGAQRRQFAPLARHHEPAREARDAPLDESLLRKAKQPPARLGAPLLVLQTCERRRHRSAGQPRHGGDLPYLDGLPVLPVRYR